MSQRQMLFIVATAAVVGVECVPQADPAAKPAGEYRMPSLFPNVLRGMVQPWPCICSTRPVTRFRRQPGMSVSRSGKASTSWQITPSGGHSISKRERANNAHLQIRVSLRLKVRLPLGTSIAMVQLKANLTFGLPTVTGRDRHSRQPGSRFASCADFERS